MYRSVSLCSMTLGLFGVVIFLIINTIIFVIAGVVYCHLWYSLWFCKWFPTLTVYTEFLKQIIICLDNHMSDMISFCRIFTIIISHHISCLIVVYHVMCKLLQVLYIWHDFVVLLGIYYILIFWIIYLIDLDCLCPNILSCHSNINNVVLLVAVLCHRIYLIMLLIFDNENVQNNCIIF